ncbi:MAG: RNA polymerase factor sigma-54 [Phycisphaerae bacterium]
MRLDTSQQLRLQQQMKLSPRIIQAMEILQLPMMSLQERIETELQANPVLEMRQGEPEPIESAPEEDEGEDRGEEMMVVDDDNGHQEDFERLEDYVSQYGQESVAPDAAPPRPTDSGAGDRKLEAMANTPARDESLNEYLLHQWSFVDADGEVAEAGRTIINEIDEDGYLRTPLEELTERSGGSPKLEHFREALPLVQALDPPGVGARNLQECLRIQLSIEAESGRDVSLEMELVEHFLKDIEMNRLPQIAQKTGRSIDEIKAAIENISHLTPRPGLLIGSSEVPVLVPDAVVDLDENGEVIVNMSDGNTPRLSISRSYRKLANNRETDKNARRFLRGNIRSAQWLIRAIDQRRETVRRVVEEVFRVQRAFLEDGPEALKPLPMTEVANRVGVHVATVSRAVAGKYVQTPRGIYPLRMFFSGGTTTAGGDDVAWDAVKAKLREIIDNEDKSKPLNDEELAEELKKHGLDIARRTVAKYRNLMDIPPARKRREY